MAEKKKKYEFMSTEEKIAENIRKTKGLFKMVDKNKKQFADGLIRQFAVTTVALERLVAELNKGDILEDFEQGTQKFRREHPALKSYNATIKSFSALSKQLVDLLPIQASKQAGEELMNFATKPPGAAKK